MRSTGVIIIDVPVRVVSVANRREHWGAKAKRTKEHRHSALYACRAVQFEPPAGPLRIELLRYFPAGNKPMDDDNLAASFKAVRDGVADWLGVDDGSASLSWAYLQEMSTDWGVRVRVHLMGADDES